MQIQMFSLKPGVPGAASDMSALLPGTGDGVRHVPFDAGRAEDSFQHVRCDTGRARDSLHLQHVNSDAKRAGDSFQQHHG